MFDFLEIFLLIWRLAALKVKVIVAFYKVFIYG
jgi:hypothetical protein